jgi:hypothetical protein
LHNRFNFDEPYQIQVKGKGPMQVYNLRGKLGGDPLHTSSPVEGQHRG